MINIHSPCAQDYPWVVDRVERMHDRPSFDEGNTKYRPDDSAGRIRPMGDNAADKVGAIQKAS